ncbi:MAG TPA: DUF5996 family protein [Pyrinomonadaceae bacterium]|jgi:hypothetical protein
MSDSDKSEVHADADAWPSLPFPEWKETCATLHMWTQVVGKIRLALTPLENHWWNVPLYVTARGLTTSPMPYGARTLQIDFDFIDHQLVIICDDGTTKTVALAPRTVADFHREVMQTLRNLGFEVRIWTMPVEIENPIRFEQDDQHASYDAEYAHRFWRALLRADTVFKEFRAAYIGKSSPVHFFWGSFDLAVTRFSGRPAPEREGADAITREAYSHEVISHGFWPGSEAFPEPAFYSYTAPEPDGLSLAPLRPPSAFYSQDLKEFLLRYDDVRRAHAPAHMLSEFLQSTYDAGADLAKWNRTALERK